MPKRRPSRRGRRDRAAGRASLPVPEPVPVRPQRDVSWTGLAGGLTGAVPLGAFVIELLVDPAGDSRWWALPFSVMAIVYLGAVWASVANVPDRKRILRNILSATLVMLVVASILTSNPGFALLLLIPSSLLAIASGVIFQGWKRTTQLRRPRVPFRQPRAQRLACLHVPVVYPSERRCLHRQLPAAGILLRRQPPARVLHPPCPRVPRRRRVRDRDRNGAVGCARPRWPRRHRSFDVHDAKHHVVH